MGGVGRRDEDGIASVALSKWGELGCVDAPSPSPEKKKIGAPSNYPGARLFYLSIPPDQK